MWLAQVQCVDEPTVCIGSYLKNVYKENELEFWMISKCMYAIEIGDLIKTTVDDHLIRCGSIGLENRWSSGNFINVPIASNDQTIDS